nr:outer membrane beta-barrel protein [uncultured Carboxylicivirga sp.]
MRKMAMLVVILTAISALRAQDKPHKQNGFKAGLTYSGFGTNDVYRFNELDGAAAIDGDSFYSIGLTFIQPLSYWLNFEGGLEYTRQSVFIYPAPMPEIDHTQRSESFGLIDIPLTLKADFMKYLFVNGGALVSLDTSTSNSVSSQTGLGFVVGLGAQYPFKCGATLFVNPYYKLRAVVGTDSNQQHTEDSGTRIGVVYHFNR